MGAQQSQQGPGTAGGSGKRKLLELGACLPILARFASTKSLINSSFIFRFLEVGRREYWMYTALKKNSDVGELGRCPNCARAATSPIWFLFFSLSTPPVPNTSHPTIPVEAKSLHKAKCVQGEQSKGT